MQTIIKLQYLKRFWEVLKWLGQAMNRHKSSLAFSKNTHTDVIQAISFELGLPIMNLKCKYLGFPLMFPLSKTQTYEETKARIMDWFFRLEVEGLASG